MAVGSVVFISCLEAPSAVLSLFQLHGEQPAGYLQLSV